MHGRCRRAREPDRGRRLGVEGVLRFVRRRGVRMSRPKAAQVVQQPSRRFGYPTRNDLHCWSYSPLTGRCLRLDKQIHDATTQLAALLPDTPAGVLLSIPGVGVLTASSYRAAIGDPNRYRDAAAAYRASGLVPVSYESAGRARSHTGISREGSVELRRAIVELGRASACTTPISSPTGCASAKVVKGRTSTNAPRARVGQTAPTGSSTNPPPHRSEPLTPRGPNRPAAINDVTTALGKPFELLSGPHGAQGGFI